MLSRGDIVYAFFILLILLVLSVLSVTGVLWAEYSKFAWVVIVVGGLALLKPIANAIGNSDPGKNFLEKIKDGFADSYASN